MPRNTTAALRRSRKLKGGGSVEANSTALERESFSKTFMEAWVDKNRRTCKLKLWVADRWLYKLRKKRCSLRRQMQVCYFRRNYLKKLAMKRYSREKLVTKVLAQDVPKLARQTFILTVGGVQTRPLSKTQAQCFKLHCQQELDRIISSYAFVNFDSIMCDTLFWRNNCTDRNSLRGFCDECKELVSQPDM